MSKQIDELKKLLDYHNHLYYDLDSPEISDVEYDVLKNKYIELTGSEYDYVPGEAQDQFVKYEHTHPILSLGKVNDEDSLRAELIRLAPGVIEPKLDGLTIVIYPDGKVVSRGNGHIGEVLPTARKIENLGFVHPDFPVRAEAIMDIVSFQAANRKRVKRGEEEFKNPRNAVAGMLRNKDISRVEGVSYLAYNLVGDTRSETDQLGELKDMGFSTVECLPYGKDNIDEAVKFCLDFDRTALPYEIDGLVVKSNIPNSLAHFGLTGHHPKNAVAYKFPAQGDWTELKDVVWQAGRTGKITPVAIVQPIDIGGSTIGRVTLHNIGIMQALKLSKGCEVLVVKANDVIPAIIESRNYNPLKIFRAPHVCPECNSELELTNDQHFCLNADCPAKLLNNIIHLAKRDALDIEGLSIETAQKMIDAGYIKHASDIFMLTKEAIEDLPGFADKSASNLFTAIQARRKTELNRFIYAAGLPNVGRHASKDIAETVLSYTGLVEDILDDCKMISKIDGIGPVIIDSLIQNVNLFTRLNEWVKPDTMEAKKTVAPDKVMTFVITGALSSPRAEFEAFITGKGHKLSGSVSKKTSYLVTNETDTGSSKMKKAKDLGVPVISEQDLIEMIS